MLHTILRLTAIVLSQIYMYLLVRVEIIFLQLYKLYIILLITVAHTLLPFIIFAPSSTSRICTETGNEQCRASQNSKTFGGSSAPLRLFQP